jgi:hypothetical protein
MSLMSSEQLERAKHFIYQHGRLLERKLFAYCFEDGTRAACVRALRAYQNEDGGFGNGLEADLLCPDSTAIGAETAMYVLEMLDRQCGEMVERLARWVIANQSEEGTIPHPPKGLFGYPFQPWWRNPDHDRILVIAALMKKWGLEHEQFFDSARRYYLTTVLPALCLFEVLRRGRRGSGQAGDHDRAPAGLAGGARRSLPPVQPVLVLCCGPGRPGGAG